jgi:hypothetical protein
VRLDAGVLFSDAQQPQQVVQAHVNSKTWPMAPVTTSHKKGQLIGTRHPSSTRMFKEFD